MSRVALLLLLSVFGPLVYSVYIDPNQEGRFLDHFDSWNNKLSSKLDGVSPAELRLPKDVIPIHYNLTIAVFLPGYGAEIKKAEEFTFKGHIEIAFENKAPVKEIVLNQRSLSVEQIILKQTNESQRKVAGKVDNRLEKLTIETGTIPPGHHRIEMIFRGKMNKGDGLFKTEYHDAEGNSHIGAATHMEPISARSMVPCFDEPQFKATWNVKIIHPTGTKAVSNQREYQTQWVADRTWFETSFMTTPKMSSYLLAIGVFNFTYYEGYTNRGMRVRIYAAPDQPGKAIALEQAIQCIEGFEKYFGIPIPLRKMDMVALNGFGGAMENWGLIYYGNEYLLGGGFQPASFISHELAHQWLGNLVTMKWWNQLYLNEGFANLMEIKGLEFIENGKYVEEQVEEISAYRSELFLIDTLRSTHPIVKNSDEYGSFAPITYKKGGAVLHMIAKVMGREKFDQGLRNYLNKYAYQNVEQDDLFAELDQMITPDQLGPDGKQLNITHFGRQWTLQTGFPRVIRKQTNDTHCELRQKRFVEEREENPIYANNPYGYKWDIPIWLKYDGSSSMEFHWLPTNDNLVIPCGKAKVHVNPGNDGFYYVSWS